MAPKPKTKGEVEILKPFTRGHAATKAFFDDLAIVTDTPLADVQRVINGLQKIAVRDLRSKGTFTLHTIGTFSVKIQPATSERPGECHGKKFTRREKPRRKSVVCKVASQLNDKAVSWERR